MAELVDGSGIPIIGGREVEAQVVKGGEVRCSVAIGRHRNGIMVRVQADRRLENFIRSLGNGEIADARLGGRYWSVVDGSEDGSIRCHNYSRPLATDREIVYRLDRLGQQLLLTDDHGRRSINISFLRIVGISDGTGVRFVVNGVFSLDQIDEIRAGIEQAITRLYYQYLKPVNYAIVVSTQEIAA